MTFVPLIGGTVLLFLPKNAKNAIRWVSVAATAVPLLLAIQLYFQFDRGTPGMQFVEKYEWISTFNIQYYMGT
ncbi:MAG: NADH-quinone oxidoreductase subunit M, partial [Pseudomonadota bacterium]